MADHASDCELCALARTTRWYAQYREPFAFTILDCDSCDTPMAVLGEHRAAISEEERAVMTGALRHLADALAMCDPDDLWFDDKMRQIPDHYHVHLRRRPSWCRTVKS
ncbi:MAG: hypothetical protein FJ144_25590 [Deltaproteobacteria bacterium]|nr:hypothetical protein [Deltaproteobacteria bacterium]